MPSPIGHALGGFAAGWLVREAHGHAGARMAAWRDVVLYAVLGMLPDVDLLFAAHSGPTHGLGAALVVGLGVWAGTRRVRPSTSRVRFAVSCGLAYASHTVLDWLGTDTTAPIGIMALWPFTREYYDSGLRLFMAVSRRYWQGERFLRQNALALVRELVILVPLVVIIVRMKGRGGLSP